MKKPTDQRSFPHARASRSSLRVLTTVTRLSWSVAAGALALASPSLASATSPCERACSCNHYVQALPSVSYQQEKSIPINARLFVPLAHEGDFTVLLHPESDPSATIPVSVEEVTGARAVWVTPESELPQGESFKLEIQWEAAEETAMDELDFYTGFPLDMEPPELSGVTAEPLGDFVSCDPFLGFTVNLPEDLDGGNLVQVLLETQGQSHTFFFEGYLGSQLTIGASQGSPDHCAPDDSEDDPIFVPTLPDATLGQTVTVTVTVFDNAGNASAPVVLADVPVEAAKPGDSKSYGACGCGCRLSGADPTPSNFALPFAALALLLRLRRGARRPKSSTKG
jgi:MYXO-CTERM domain-containing protein